MKNVLGRLTKIILKNFLAQKNSTKNHKNDILGVAPKSSYSKLQGHKLQGHKNTTQKNLQIEFWSLQ